MGQMLKAERSNLISHLFDDAQPVDEKKTIELRQQAIVRAKQKIAEKDKMIQRQEKTLRMLAYSGYNSDEETIANKIHAKAIASQETNFAKQARLLARQAEAIRARHLKHLLNRWKESKLHHSRWLRKTIKKMCHLRFDAVLYGPNEAMAKLRCGKIKDPLKLSLCLWKGRFLEEGSQCQHFLHHVTIFNKSKRLERISFARAKHLCKGTWPSEMTPFKKCISDARRHFWNAMFHVQVKFESFMANVQQQQKHKDVQTKEQRTKSTKEDTGEGAVAVPANSEDSHGAKEKRKSEEGIARFLSWRATLPAWRSWKRFQRQENQIPDKATTLPEKSLPASHKNNVHKNDVTWPNEGSDNTLRHKSVKVLLDSPLMKIFITLLAMGSFVLLGMVGMKKLVCWRNSKDQELSNVYQVVMRETQSNYDQI